MNIHSLMCILINLVYQHTVQCFLYSFDVLGKEKDTNAFHKTNHVISYNDIGMHNAAWSGIVSEDKLHFLYFCNQHNTS